MVCVLSHGRGLCCRGLVCYVMMGVCAGVNIFMRMFLFYAMVGCLAHVFDAVKP